MLFRSIDRGDVAELDVVVSAEEMLLMYAGDLENDRRLIAEEVSAEVGIPVEELTPCTWPGMDDKKKERIEKLQSEFLGTLSEITKVNDINSRLLSIQLDYIQQVVDEVTSTRREHTYDPVGSAKSKVSQQVNLLDRTI